MKPVPSFLVDLIQRLFTAKPQFFKYIQIFSGVIALIAFVPDIFAMLDINAPAWLSILNEKSIKAGALMTLLMAQLPNKQVNQP